MKQKTENLGKIKRGLSNMNNIKTTSSWFFSHVKYKNIFPFLPFALMFAPLLTIFWAISTNPHNA
jgi:hypothetical protein